MGSKELFDEATEIKAVDGEVELDGPDGVDVALTPEAAEETADRMFALRLRPQNSAGLIRDGLKNLLRADAN